MDSRYLDIEDRTQDLAECFRDEPGIGQEFTRMYELSWVHHDNALEGVMFSGAEIAHALENQPLAEASSLAALREIRNFKAAIDIARAEAGAKQIAITLDLVKRLHDTLVGGPDPKAVGEWRKEIPLHRAYFHEIAAPAKIAAMMQKLVEWCASEDFAELHPIHAASKLQHTFMQIYPYTEAPGKVARLLGNIVLIHHGYQPLIVHTIDRQRYYDALRLPEPQLRDLVMDSMENSLANGEKFFRAALRARRKAAR
jgi:Fic family protein